jgi:hypothetical protein
VTRRGQVRPVRLHPASGDVAVEQVHAAGITLLADLDEQRCTGTHGSSVGEHREITDRVGETGRASPKRARDRSNQPAADH